MGPAVEVKTKWVVLAAALLFLSGCASLDSGPDSRSMAMQPPMTADCPDDVVINVRFVRHRNMNELSAAYERACTAEQDAGCVTNAARMRENGQQAQAFSTTRNGTGELHYVAPKDFNDWYRLALVGHEAMHLCGARHDIVPARKGMMTVFGYREFAGGESPH